MHVRKCKSHTLTLHTHPHTHTSSHVHIVRNPCTTNNGGCSHLCLTRPSKRRSNQLEAVCACPIGHSLMEDEQHCNPGVCVCVCVCVCARARVRVCVPVL